MDFGDIHLEAISVIRNNPSFRQKHVGVPDDSDCSDGTWYPPTELHACRRPGDRSCCILTSCTLRPECGDVYAPSERHMCYTLRRGCSYAVAVYTMPGNVYAFLRPIATCRTLIYV